MKADGCSAFMVALSAFVVAVIMTAVFATVPMYLCWNYALMPAVPAAHLESIGWLQAFGLSVFCRILVPSPAAAESKKGTE